MKPEMIDRLLGALGDAYVDPILDEIAEKNFETQPLSNHILSVIRRWKITTSKVLQEALVDTGTRTRAAYEQAIKRLLKADSFFNVRIGSTAYYFHPSQSKHWEKLKETHPIRRQEYLETNGIAHHIAVQETFNWLNFIRFNVDGVLPIVGPDELGRYFTGSLAREADLSIISSQGEIAIEVERNSKSRKRWHEKWLDYECNSRILGVIYFVEDEQVYNSLRTCVGEFFQEARSRDSKFWIGITASRGERIAYHSTLEKIVLHRIDDFLKRFSIPKETWGVTEATPFRDRYPILFRSQVDQELQKQQ